MSIDSMIGREKPNGSFPHTDRTELDDLLDEILSDQIFLDHFPSQQLDGDEKSQEPAAKQQNCIQVSNLQQCNVGSSQTGVPISWESRATNGSATCETAPGKNQADASMTPQDISSGNNSNTFPDWIEGGTEIQTGARNRAPSLPVNCYAGADHRRRLQSVPCNDFYGQAQGSISQSYYGQPDRFVRGLCSEEPIKWLDQQKIKLQTRNANKRWLDRSNQQKQLMEELRAAQALLAQKQLNQAQEDAPNERYADSSHANTSQTLEHQRYRSRSPAQTTERIDGLDLSQPDADTVRRSSDVCKSERSYYISGIERPPFTTHQTKYVFSVSSPHASQVNLGDGSSPNIQLNQKVNTKPGPPTPRRVSSRDALRHSLMYDWEPELWEQESHTSLSSRSDAPERSAFPAMEKGNAPGVWNPEGHVQQTFHSSSAGYLDPSGMFESSYDPRTHSHNHNGPTLNSNGLPVVNSTLINAGADLVHVNGTSLSLNSNGNFGTLLNGSGTPSLSVNGTSQSAFDPVSQCSAYGDTSSSYNQRGALYTAPLKPELDLLPVSASIVVTSHKSSPSSAAVHQSFSDPALERSNLSGKLRNLKENAPINPEQNRRAVYEASLTCSPSSSSFPSDVPFPSTSAVSPPGPQSSGPHVLTSGVPLEHSLMRSDDIHNQSADPTDTRQLSAIDEQTSGNDGTEVISLQLIGPGMQNLEPDGSLPAIRPVTPKFPNAGVAVNISNSSKTRQGGGSLDDQHRDPEEKVLPDATLQKFNSAQRRTTLATCSRQPVAGDSSEERRSCDNELGLHSAEILNEDDQTNQRLKHRRNTTADGRELLRSKDSNEIRRSSGHNSSSEAAPSTAYRRTERLLSADFTMQCFNRRGSTSPGDQPRRRSNLLSQTENCVTCLKTDRLDGLDDVFAAKPTSGDDKRRDSKSRKPQQKELNLTMLDNAVAGLQASANSPVDESSSSNTLVQSPQSGKTTPGFYAGHATKSPRTSIHPLSSGTASSSTNNADVTIRASQTPRFVRDSSKFWHKPNISRDEAIACLKDKPAGTFVIRNSNSFPGAFGLALKVSHLPPNVHSRGGDPKAELVRHFLIEPTSKGVKLKGCTSEPMFGSLASLVYQHSLTPLSLPCKLIIPDKSNLKMQEDAAASSDATTSEVLSQGAACNVLYINSVDMESLTGNEAIDKAVAATFATMPSHLTTVVHFKVSSQGVTLTDTNRKLFFRRHYPVDAVTFAGIDPELRSWTWTNEETKSTLKSKIFGFVARKQGSPMDNSCHVFAELDSDQPAQAIVEFIMKVMIGQGRPKKHSIYSN